MSTLEGPGDGPSSQQRTTLPRPRLRACMRCKEKKRRCDNALPTCRLCRGARVECVSMSDAPAQEDVPRSDLLSLQKRIADLESLLQRNNIPYDNQAVVPSEDLDMHTSTIQTSMQHVLEHTTANTAPNIGHAGPDSFAAQTIPDNILNLTQCSPGKEPAFSNNLLRRVIGAKLSPQTTTPIPSQSLSTKGPPLSDLMREFESTQIYPPSREVADKLVDVYFQFAQTGSPLLHEASFRRKLDVVYASPELMSRADERSDNDFKLATFLVFAVLAVAIVIRQRREPRQALIAQANSYHKMALQFYQAAVLPNDMSDVVRLLLIAKFSYHHPEEWDVWKPIGAALRLAIELGLHKDQETTEPDALVLDMKRRVFWVAYTMDRSVAIGFNMPLGISDGAITTKFPSEVDDEFITPSGINDPKDGRFWSKRIGIHLLHYRRLQSEMHNMLYEKPWPANSTLDLGEWQSGMGDRLWKWYRECPVGNNLNNEARINLENFELSLYRALVYLYGPSPNIPDPSDVALVALSEAAAHVILVYRRCFRESRLTLLWQAVDGLSSAGTGLLYSYQHCAAVREQIAVSSLASAIQTCTYVLGCMVQHFPAFQDKCDAFVNQTSAGMVCITANSHQPNALLEWPNGGNDGIFGAGNVEEFVNEDFLGNDFFSIRAEEFSDNHHTLF